MSIYNLAAEQGLEWWPSSEWNLHESFLLYLLRYNYKQKFLSFSFIWDCTVIFIEYSLKSQQSVLVQCKDDKISMYATESQSLVFILTNRHYYCCYKPAVSTTIWGQAVQTLLANNICKTQNRSLWPSSNMTDCVDIEDQILSSAVMCLKYNSSESFLFQ